jgi:hypothetical protein
MSHGPDDGTETPDTPDESWDDTPAQEQGNDGTDGLEDWQQ